LLRSSEFRRVYAKGFRVASPYFTAVCLEITGAEGPRIGFTVPRAAGEAVVRNRLKRRLREAVRRQLHQLPAQWEVAIQPRRAALKADFQDLEREMERLFKRCAG
jgi:ribonuclease P protein component